MGNISFAVVRAVGAPESGENLAIALPLYVKTEQGTEANGWLGRFEQLRDPGLALALHAPVFSVGEILILDADGREIGYPGRKPSKWSVEVESFDTAEAATARAAELLA